MLENKNYPYKFDETQCAACGGKCCIGEPGYIWITKEECVKLAAHLKISVIELGQKYLIKANYKFSIKEKQISENSYACVFFDLDKKQCSVYDARPNQCRTFPFWDYFKKNVEEVKKECQAIVD